MKKRGLLIVEWDDISATSGWKSEDNVDKECNPLRSVTVGWRMKSDRKTLRVASTRTEDGRCSDVNAIPRGCIVSIKRLSDV